MEIRTQAEHGEVVWRFTGHTQLDVWNISGGEKFGYFVPAAEMSQLMGWIRSYEGAPPHSAPGYAPDPLIGRALADQGIHLELLATVHLNGSSSIADYGTNEC